MEIITLVVVYYIESIDYVFDQNFSFHHSQLCRLPDVPGDGDEQSRGRQVLHVPTQQRVRHASHAGQLNAQGNARLRAQHEQSLLLTVAL